ncbi:glycoside hydrolase family 3 C-terminal domain-containing protein [Pelagicoccus albus]|uniref:Glycoside hydrolase family 3 C-terminal domain-containing protein n=1 Tax=Pelagicoccus albus TaxID=415222 RepID=A0A7X1E9T3_9BACT|nr:glycoside hydrolase family 3 C-terminal domain-containing protein [Pelagicoccus albus]MBC2607518.1 glycoside hydrolase family 3 C-terminal domain-containing protein [Pelagicoccus albus]
MNTVPFSKSFLSGLKAIGMAGVFVLTCWGEEPAYLDADAPMDERIHDLISRLTLDEKAELMKNESIGVPRLDIPAYDWWNEALHGVARAGEATVFPQAIGLAAMWDVEQMYEVADVISTEARAKHHEFIRNGIHDRYTGLTFWSPNINIFRDPRWGRGQETYGEDPYLTGQTGLAFVTGMQGDDPDYLKTAATAKHFAVHSGPETDRYSFNADPTAADFYETYLPAFEVLVKEGKVEAVMSAYNAIFNVPTTMSPVLYDILDAWEFDGHVVSDCGAVYCIFEKFGMARDFAEAEALALQAGLCLRCGDGDATLADAVRRGLISNEILDEQLFKLLRTWFRLGMFDPAERVSYAQIPLSANDTAENSQVALEAAEKSIVLLKNDGILPLDAKKTKRILVVGPNANSIPALLGNYNGTPSDPKTIVESFREILPDSMQIDFMQGTDYVASSSAVSIVPRIVLASGDFSTATDGDVSGLIASYYDNKDISGEPVSSNRSHQIEFNWGEGSPAANVSADEFSAEWTGLLTTGIGGEYEFIVEANGGVRVFLGEEEILADWTSGEKSLSVVKNFADNEVSTIRIQYFHDDSAGEDDAHIYFKWRIPPADAAFENALALAEKADAVIFVGGISAQLEGEDMRVDYEGFGGGDRSRIELPTIQQELAKELAGTGTPLVFVNLSGSAMAFESVNDSANALLQAWYPGQRGGEALANILFGKVNPAGRLPVTFYGSTNDLPDFKDYKMDGRTYRYFEGEVPYAFGHGLSYTQFKYQKLSVKEAEKGGFDVSVKLRNIGKLSGDEVVQAYLISPDYDGKRELLTLAAFDRVSLAKGESKSVSLNIKDKQFLRWNDSYGEMRKMTGEWKIAVGSASDDLQLEETFIVD